MIKEGNDLIEGVHRLFLPVHGFVIIPEAVSGTIVAMEFVVLLVEFEDLLGLVDLLRIRMFVIVAEDAEERAF